MSDASLELLMSGIILLAVFVGIRRRWRTRRAPRLAQIGLWVAGINIGLLPLVAWTIDSDLFYKQAGFHSFSLYILFFSYLAGLWAISQIVTTSGGSVAQRNPFRVLAWQMPKVISFKSISLLYIALIVSRLVDFFAFNAGMSGLGTLDVALSKPYGYVIIQQLIDVFKPLIFFWVFMNVTKAYSKQNAIMWFMIALEISYSLFFTGRSYFVVLLFMMLLCYFLRYGRLRLNILLPISLIFFLFWHFVSPAFLIFRAGYTEYADSGLKSAELFNIGIQALEDRYESGREESDSNLASRLLGTSDYMRFLIDRQRSIAPMNGQAIWGSLSLTIPRFLNPYKGLEHPEAHVVRHYSVIGADPSRTVFSTGLADFGLVGGVLTGLFVGLLLWFGEAAAVRAHKFSALIGSAMFLQFFFLALSYEASATSYFVSVRNVLVLFGLIYCMRIVNKASRKRPAEVVYSPPHG